MGIASFVNTVAALAEEENLTEETFDIFIRDIATPGGCTEKGLQVLNSIQDIVTDEKDKNKIYPFFSKVHKRTKRFKKDVALSFVGIPDDVEHQIFNALASGNYPL